MPPRPTRIVAIDSDAAVGQRLMTAFWGPDYAFHWFADGRDALGALQEIRPHAIVCELMLTGLSGRAVLEAVRRSPELRDVPFLVLSSIRSDAIIDATLEAGATAYLVKPFSVSELKQTIRAVLEDQPSEPDLDLTQAPGPAVAATGAPLEPSPLRAPKDTPAGEAPAPAIEATPEVKSPRRRRAGQKPRKRKPPAAQAPPSEPSNSEGDWDLTFPEPAFAPPEASAQMPTSAAAPGPYMASWSRIARVAAILLAIGTMSGSQPRDPLTDGVAPEAVPESSGAPTVPAAVSATPAPPPVAEPTPEAEPSPEASMPPPAEPPRPARRNVDQMVRGRLQWAQALYDEGRYDDARAALSEVIKLAPASAEARKLEAQLARFAAPLPGSMPSAPEEDQRAVLALLQRYQTALEQSDATSLNAIWPNVGADALSRQRTDGLPRPLALRLVRLEVTGDEALALCVTYDGVTTPAGAETRRGSRVAFQLRRANGSWVIDDVQ